MKSICQKLLLDNANRLCVSWMIRKFFDGIHSFEFAFFRADGAKEVEVVSYQGYNGLLEGKKVNVINAEGADIFFVVARNQMQSEVIAYSP